MAAYFEVETIEKGAPFVIRLDDPDLIQHARDLLSGATDKEPHVIGRIRKRSAPYNPRWSYFIDPESIQFFDFAIEVCDATFTYTEEHLDDACGPFLPGCMFCPWSSRLVREVPSP